MVYTKRSHCVPSTVPDGQAVDDRNGPRVTRWRTRGLTLGRIYKVKSLSRTSVVRGDTGHKEVGDDSRFTDRVLVPRYWKGPLWAKTVMAVSQEIPRVDDPRDEYTGSLTRDILRRVGHLERSPLLLFPLSHDVSMTLVWLWLCDLVNDTHDR